MRSPLLALALATLPLQTVSAQVLRVTLRDSTTGDAVIGALVAALDSANAVQREVLSTTDGVATLALPAPGTVRVRVRRIGFAPILSPAIAVPAGATTPYTFTLRSARATLARVTVRSRAAVCGVAPDADDATGQLWDRVNIALRSTAITRDRNTSLAVTEYVRDLDQSLREVSMQVRRNTVTIGRAFQAIDPAKLATEGYITRAADGTMNYYAPDDRVWLSPFFAQTHCFAADGVDPATGEARLRFTPDGDKSMGRINGVAYVDTLTEEPRRITFGFTAPPSLLPVRVPHLGGEVHLTRLASGEWIVSKWYIRVPVLGTGGQEQRAVIGSTAGEERVLLLLYRESGGTAAPVSSASVARADSTLAPAFVRVRVTDRRNRALIGARVDLVGVGLAGVTNGLGEASVRRLKGQAMQLEVRATDMFAELITVPSGTADTSVTVALNGASVSSNAGVNDEALLLRVGYRTRRVRASGQFLDGFPTAASDNSSALDVLGQASTIEVVPFSDTIRPLPDPALLGTPWDARTRLPVSREVRLPGDVRCLPSVFVDGRPASPAALALMPRRDVLAMEVYARGTSVPLDFQRTPPPCGAVLVWMRGVR